MNRHQVAHPVPAARSRRWRAAGAAALASALAGCSYTIKLDPGADDAAVYVNGDLRGSGVSRFEADSEFGFPDRFTAKVVPASGSGSAYSVVISREMDWGRGLYQLGQTVITGAAFLGVHYLGVRDQIGDKPESWANLMFPAPWSLGFIGGLMVVTAPLNLLQSFRYREFYDLSAMRDAAKAQEAARAEKSQRMRMSAPEE